MSRIIKISSYGGLGLLIGHLADAAGHDPSTWEYWVYLGIMALLILVIDVIE